MGGSDVLGDFLDQNSKSRTLAPGAVLSQVLLMGALSLVTVIAFNVLRPSNKVVYEPKVKYHVGDKVPPRISDSPFGWVSPLIRVKEPELLDKVGLDAVTYLRFLRMCRWLFTGIAVLACGILIPINVAYNLKNVDENNRDILSMLTIRDVKGNVLFIHVGVTYLMTFLVMSFIWFHWKAMVRLRHTWFRSPEYMKAFYARTLMVRNVPKKLQSDEGLRSVFESIEMPYRTTAVHIGRRVGDLPDLIKFHNETVCKLEAVLVRYLKGGKIDQKRPTIRKGGFLGIGGKTEDAIDFYTRKLERCEARIEACREDIASRKPENYGFASMATVPFAHAASQALVGKHPRGTDITLAPNPKDIIWANLSKSEATLARKRVTGWMYLGILCFINTLPLLVVSFLANLASIAAYVPFLQKWAESSPKSFSIVSGVLPATVAGIFGFFLPIFMRRLSKYQGAITRSRLDRAVVARYFAFLMISQLVIFTLIGVIFISVEEIVSQIGQHKSFSEIIHNLDKLPSQINRTYINQASFWLTYFPLRGFLVVFDLAQVAHLVWVWIRTSLFGRTPRDIREWTKPPDFEYAIYFSNLLFMAAVGMVFAPLAPLVALGAAIVFWLSSWVYKYQLMFVYVTKVESGGRLWNVVINRLLVTVIFMQLLMTLTIGLQHGFKSLQWIASIPPIFIIIAFKTYISRVFSRPFRYFTPRDEDLRLDKGIEATATQTDSRRHNLEKRFGHPALHAELYTPMLHSKMMHLLPQVYRGRLKDDSARLDEYGGQKMEAQVIPGGIKIAAIHQRDLEYDPQQYQRDRGEVDFDQRSMSSSNLLGDTNSIFAAKATADYGRHSPAPSGYANYLAKGPGGGNDIELRRLDTPDSAPLLNQYQQQGYFDQQQRQSPAPSPYHAYAPSGGQHSPLLPPGVPPGYSNQPEGGYREAPLHRPYPPSHSSRQQSTYREGSISQWSAAPTDPGIAGRGTYGGGGRY